LSSRLIFARCTPEPRHFFRRRHLRSLHPLPMLLFLFFAEQKYNFGGESTSLGLLLDRLHVIFFEFWGTDNEILI
jgi:hypothetical protein